VTTTFSIITSGPASIALPSTTVMTSTSTVPTTTVPTGKSQYASTFECSIKRFFQFTCFFCGALIHCPSGQEQQNNCTDPCILDEDNRR
jgi:hypothetical protein